MQNGRWRCIQSIARFNSTISCWSLDTDSPFTDLVALLHPDGAILERRARLMGWDRFRPANVEECNQMLIG